MIAAELRGGSKPSLNEALGWIGSRVDDIYGANVGRLDDVWIDPGTGAPRWLLVTEGRFGGRSTLIPFEDATAGAGHVWVPYERDIVRGAPEIEPGAPLTQDLETALRAHYSAGSPRSASRGPQSPPPAAPVQPHAPEPPSGGPGTTTIRFGGPRPAPEEPASAADSGVASFGQSPPAAGRREDLAAVPSAEAPPRLPERPAPPIAAPPQEADPYRYAPPPREEPAASPPPAYGAGESEEAWRPHERRGPRAFGAVQSAPPQAEDPYRYAPPPEAHDPYRYAPPPRPAERPAPQQGPPDPAQGPIDQLRDLAAQGGTHFIEIELSGELSIRGELRSVRVTPHRPQGS